METDFKKPTLEALYVKSTDLLRKYIVDNLCIGLYKKYVKDGIIEESADDLNRMESSVEALLKSLESKKEEEPENEVHIFEIDKKICETHAQTFNVPLFNKLSQDLLAKDYTVPLRMDILMCKIRIAIILEDRKLLVTSIDEAEAIFEASSDWDRKNRFRVYLGLYYLIKGEFKSAADCFHDSLASFDATELLEFEKVIFYLVFAAMISYNRSEIQAKVVGNPEVRKCSEFLVLPESFLKCEYNMLFWKLLEFIEACEDDVFLQQYTDHFCKQVKAHGYQQLLLCYQSLHLQKIADCFGVDADYVEEDLRNFIVDGKLNCMIDKIDGIVRMNEGERSQDPEYLFKLGESILRNIKKSIN